jgi:hypothetical protein
MCVYVLLTLSLLSLLSLLYCYPAILLYPGILECLAQPKTAVAADAAGNAILHKSSSHSIRIVTAVLYESFASMKWQTKKVSV